MPSSSLWRLKRSTIAQKILKICFLLFAHTLGNLTRNGLGISCKDWDCQHATHGQNVMNRAQSLSGVNKNFTADIEECDEDQPHCERNKFLVCGLSECTTKEGLENFIQAKSGEEVKEVQIMKQHSALVTMANEIRSK